MSAPTTPKPSPETAVLLQRKQVEAMLISRAWEDDQFRKRLLADPRATLGEALGIEIPSSVSVKIQEESADALVLTLPAKPKGGELSDVDLEQVAGGEKGAVAAGHTSNLVDYGSYCMGKKASNWMESAATVIALGTFWAIGFSYGWRGTPPSQ
jgi:hypothetical protein